MYRVEPNLWDMVAPTCQCGEQATRRGCLLPDSYEPVCLCEKCYENEGATEGNLIKGEEDNEEM